jgi:hypothetical protein
MADVAVGQAGVPGVSVSAGNCRYAVSRLRDCPGSSGRMNVRS